jgi:hypothetical protein
MQYLRSLCLKYIGWLQMMKIGFIVTMLLLAATAGCFGTQGHSRYVLADFKRAPSRDRSDLGEPVIAELRSRIGISVERLINPIGDTDIKTVDRQGNGV